MGHIPWGSLKENALGGRPAGSPARENSRRSSGVDVGDRADGGARVAAQAFLVDDDGRGDVLDGVHVRPPVVGQEGPDEGAEGLVELPLSLGRKGVEHQGRLARAGDTGEDGQLLSRDPK